MKIGEKVLSDPGDENKFVVQNTYSNEPYLQRAKMLRESGVKGFGESRLVGSIPMHLISEWLKEAGVSWDDRGAVQDIMRRKLLSGEFDKFRVWEGTY